MNKLNKLIKLYKRGKKLSCVTAYDASMSKYLDSCGIDIILVGYSLGQVIKGQKSTHNVTMKEIIYHASCVKSGNKSAVLMVDLPKDSYKSKAQAYKNASYFISNKLADLLKVEIDKNNIDIVHHLVKNGIPICAHIGLLPQSIKNKSGFRKYGKTEKEAQYYYTLAMQLNKINVNIILVECLDNSIAKSICKNAHVPVIGIGSGYGIDGQVAVIYDLLGISFNKIDAFTTNDTSTLDKQMIKFKRKLK